MTIGATANRLRAVLLLTALFAGVAAVRAQNTSRLAQSPLMTQFQRTLSLAEPAAAYEEALKLGPNDGDLLLKAGIYKLAAYQKEEALKLLQHCVRVLPGDADAQSPRPSETVRSQG